MATPEPNSARWFAEHVQPHEPVLRAWLRERFPRLGEVDDIVQEACSRTWRTGTTTPLANPKAYLFATARNIALDHFRSPRVRTTNSLAETDVADVLDETTDIPGNLARRQDLELLTAALQALPNRCRQVLTLRKIYGLSQKQIAAQLGIAEHTVEAQVGIGIRKCAEFLRRRRDR